MIPNRREGLYIVQTDAHRAMGSLGLAVRFEHGTPVEWTLESDRRAGLPAWTSSVLGAVACLAARKDAIVRKVEP